MTRFDRALLGGTLAGVAAAVAAVLVVVLLRARIPPVVASAGSAFAAGVIGGLVFFAWSRAVRRPVQALWITSLLAATVISLLIAFVPFPAERGGIPIPGLLSPLRQIGALVGLGKLSTFYFPKSALWVAIFQHYITAIIVSLVVPRVAAR